MVSLLLRSNTIHKTNGSVVLTERAAVPYLPQNDPCESIRVDDKCKDRQDTQSHQKLLRPLVWICCGDDGCGGGHSGGASDTVFLDAAADDGGEG